MAVVKNGVTLLERSTIFPTPQLMNTEAVVSTSSSHAYLCWTAHDTAVNALVKLALVRLENWVVVDVCSNHMAVMQPIARDSNQQFQRLRVPITSAIHMFLEFIVEAWNRMQRKDVSVKGKPCLITRAADRIARMLRRNGGNVLKRLVVLA